MPEDERLRNKERKALYFLVARFSSQRTKIRFTARLVSLTHRHGFNEDAPSSKLRIDPKLAYTQAIAKPSRPAVLDSASKKLSLSFDRSNVVSSIFPGDSGNFVLQRLGSAALRRKLRHTFRRTVLQTPSFLRVNFRFFQINVNIDIKIFVLVLLQTRDRRLRSHSLRSIFFDDGDDLHLRFFVLDVLRRFLAGDSRDRAVHLGGFRWNWRITVGDLGLRGGSRVDVFEIQCRSHDRIHQLGDVVYYPGRRHEDEHEVVEFRVNVHRAVLTLIVGVDRPPRSTEDEARRYE